MQQVRVAARRKYTPEEKVRIVLEGFRREVAVNELCRREGIKPGAYYAWTKDFMEAGKERLTRDTVRDATRREIDELKRDNTELKQLVADLSLEVYRLKKTAIPPLENGERRMPSMLTTQATQCMLATRISRNWTSKHSKRWAKCVAHSEI